MIWIWSWYLNWLQNANTLKLGCLFFSHFIEWNWRPLSLKGSSKCPRTNYSVPGRPGTKWIKIFQKNNQISCFWTLFSRFRTSFSCFGTSFSALSRFVPCPAQDFDCPGPSCPEFWLSRPIPSLGKIFSLSRCPFVPGQWRNFCPVVPKSCTVPSRWKP